MFSLWLQQLKFQAKQLTFGFVFEIGLSPLFLGSNFLWNLWKVYFFQAKFPALADCFYHSLFLTSLLKIMYYNLHTCSHTNLVSKFIWFSFLIIPISYGLRFLNLSDMFFKSANASLFQKNLNVFLYQNIPNVWFKFNLIKLRSFWHPFFENNKHFYNSFPSC